MTRAAEAMANDESAAGWIQATLGDFVATRTRGIVPNKTPDTTFELYSVPSLDTGAPEIVTGSEVGSNKQIVDEGTVLLCKINPRINRTWVVSSQTPNQKIASTEWITFPPNESFEPKYLAYYLKQDTVRDFLAANASGVGGSLMRVKPTTLKDYPIPLASLDQQKRIVAEIEKQFSRLDEAVANLKRVKANLKRYKAAVLKAAASGRLVETEAERARREGRSFETGTQLLQRILETRRSQWKGKGKYKEPAAPDTTDLPELPEGWVWATVEQLSSLVEYGSSAKTREDTTGVPVLRMGNIVEGELVFDELKYLPTKHDEFPKLLLKPGDLLFNRTNSPELVGKTAVFVGSLQKFSFASYLIRVRLVQGVEPKFLAAFINSAYGRNWVKSVVTQQVGQANVNGTKLQVLAVPLSPETEQHRIVSELDRRISLVREVEGQVDANFARAERLRQSTLSRAFSGRLSCNEIGAEWQIVRVTS